MNRQKKIWLLIGLMGSFLLYACTPQTSPPSINITATPLDENELATSTPTATPQHEPTPTSPLPSQTAAVDPGEKTQRSEINLDATLNLNDHSITVSETITYTNQTGQTLTHLPVVIPALTTPGLFTLINLQNAGESVNYSLDPPNFFILIELDPSLAKEEQIELQLLFHLQLPEGKYALGYTSRQTLLSDWYAFVPPFHNQDWIINPPGLVGEFLSYPLIDFDVILRLNPAPGDQIVAASAPIISQEGHVYHYQVDNRRNFSLAISTEYQVATYQDDTMEIMVYTFPEHAGMGNRAAELAARAWMTFTKIYGDNQRTFMSVVEAEIVDGLETDGLFYLSDWYFSSADETPQNYFELLVVHETAHQWFFGLVGSDQALESWLDETLCTYSELLFYEIEHPELVDWWWQFRVAAYSPSGMVNATIYDFSDPRAYINAVYLQGAIFLQEIRETIGEQAFFDFIYDYAHSTGNERRTTDDFFRILQMYYDTDLNPVISRYFKSP